MASVGARIEALKAEPDNAELMARAAKNEGAVAFVHFDPGTATSNMVEALIHHDDLTKIHRGMYVHLASTKDGRRYSGRVVRDRSYGPDALQAQLYTCAVHSISTRAREVFYRSRNTTAGCRSNCWARSATAACIGATRRPHPASPIMPYDAALMEEMLHLAGQYPSGHA